MLIIQVLPHLKLTIIDIFSLSALWWRRIRGSWRLPNRRDWLRGKLGLVLRSRAKLSKSLISIFCWWVGLCSLPVIYLGPNNGGLDSKASVCNAGVPGLIPGLGRSPGEGNGNALQYCLENSMETRAWRAAEEAFSLKWNRIARWPNNYPPQFIPESKEDKCPHGSLYTKAESSVIHKSPRVETPQCSLADEWTNRKYYVQKMEYCLAIEWNDMLTSYSMANIENPVLGEGSQTQMTTYCVTLLSVKCPRQANL